MNDKRIEEKESKDKGGKEEKEEREVNRVLTSFLFGRRKPNF